MLINTGGGGGGRGHDPLYSALQKPAAVAEGSTKAILATRQANARSRKLASVSMVGSHLSDGDLLVKGSGRRTVIIAR